MSEPNFDNLATEDYHPDEETVNIEERFAEVSRNNFGAKVWKCLMCNKISHHKKHFLQHFMIHTGAKPFACMFCSYRAGRKYHLERHIISIHQTEKH